MKKYISGLTLTVVFLLGFCFSNIANTSPNKEFAISKVGGGTSEYRWVPTNGPGVISETNYGEYPECKIVYEAVSNRIYAATNNSPTYPGQGVWYYDGSWHDTGTLSEYWVEDIVVGNQGDIYVIAHNDSSSGVWEYHNYVWSNLGNPAGGTTTMNTLTFDPDNNRVYVGGESNNIYYYDGSWHSIAFNEVSYEWIDKLCWDNVNNRLYAKASDSLYYFDGSWHDTNRLSVASLSYDSSRDRLWAATDFEGIWYYDGSWHRAGQEVSEGFDLVFYDQYTNKVYASYIGELWCYDSAWHDITTNFDEDYDYSPGSPWLSSIAVNASGTLYGSNQSEECGVFVRRIKSQPNPPGPVTPVPKPGPVSPIPNIDVKRSWYFAEGTTRTDYEEWVLIQNPSTVKAPTYLLLMTPEKAYVTNLVELDPQSRTTVKINDLVFNEDVSVQVCSSNPDIVCERSVYWDNKMEGSESIGVTEPSSTWYLAEGCTAYGYQTWVCLQNPSSKTVQVSLTYNSDTGPLTRPVITMQPNSRYTVDVRSDIGEKNVSTYVQASSPIVAERAMYWGYGVNPRRGGHCSIGTTRTVNTWYLAEGSTMYGFDEWVLVQNPNGVPVTVDVTYLTPNGPVQKPAFQMSPQSRFSIHVNDDLFSDVSVKVSSREAGIIAERAMYWECGKTVLSAGKAGTDTIGVPYASREICFAEGCTAYDFEEWLCLMNPNPITANVNLTFATTEGTKVSSISIPPNSRATIDVNSVLQPYSGDVSVKITADNPIMAERAMYWGKYFSSSDIPSYYEKRIGGHVSIGYSQ